MFGKTITNIIKREKRKKYGNVSYCKKVNKESSITLNNVTYNHLTKIKKSKRFIYIFKINRFCRFRFILGNILNS